ncbi:GxxExxY protein [Pirellulaceae bacterium SH449]
MPVRCNVPIEPLSTEEFRDLDYLVMRHAFDSQNELGRLADERIYQNDLAERLRSEGIEVQRELEIVASFDHFTKSFYLDLLVAGRGVYELKVVNAISEAHIGQLLNYLFLLDLPRGKLLNFGSPKITFQFVNAPFRTAQRRTFRFVDHQYCGDDQFKQLILGLLRDWRTSLSLSLYREAIIELLGGEDVVEVRLPLCRKGVNLGNQRFHLATPNSAFRVTAMTRESDQYEDQLARLIHFSPLDTIHWINIGHEELVLKSVRRRG